MTRSEALTTYAALAIGRAIWHSQGLMPASLLGSMLTRDDGAVLTKVLERALAAVDKEVTELAVPIGVGEFHAEVRRIANSDALSDMALDAMRQSGATLEFVSGKPALEGEGN